MMASSRQNKYKGEKPTGSVIAFAVLILILLLFLILALRSGTVVEEINNPSFATIDTCGGFCKGVCVRGLYDKMRAELYVEMNLTYCVCTCNSTLHHWIAGE